MTQLPPWSNRGRRRGRRRHKMNPSYSMTHRHRNRNMPGMDGAVEDDDLVVVVEIMLRTEKTAGDTRVPHIPIHDTRGSNVDEYFDCWVSIVVPWYR